MVVHLGVDLEPDRGFQTGPGPSRSAPGEGKLNNHFDAANRVHAYAGMTQLTNDVGLGETPCTSSM